MKNGDKEYFLTTIQINYSFVIINYKKCVQNKKLRVYIDYNNN